MGRDANDQGCETGMVFDEEVSTDLITIYYCSLGVLNVKCSVVNKIHSSVEGSHSKRVHRMKQLSTFLT